MGHRDRDKVPGTQNGVAAVVPSQVSPRTPPCSLQAPPISDVTCGVHSPLRDSERTPCALCHVRVDRTEARGSTLVEWTFELGSLMKNIPDSWWVGPHGHPSCFPCPHLTCCDTMTPSDGVIHGGPQLCPKATPS